MRKLDSCSVCVRVLFFKMFDSKCKICVDDSNSEAPEFPLLN